MSRLAASGKLRAFLIHLGLSASVVGLVGLAMLWIWYPQPWFMHDGGWTVFRIMLAVDVVLGPLLTLIVYGRGKPGLVRDLSIIATLQLGALAFGVTTMLLHRPAYIVYAEENFFAVTWSQARQGTSDPAKLAAFKSLAQAGNLPLLYLELPADPALRAQLRNAPEGSPPVFARGDYYRSITAEDWKHILSRGPSIEDLARGDESMAAELAQFKSRHPADIARLGFISVVCRNDVVMLAIDRDNGAIAGWLD